MRDLRASLITLGKMQLELEQGGGPANNGDLFEECIYAEEDILRKFGLPSTRQHSDLLCLNRIPSEKDLLKLIEKLHAAAKKYLGSPTKTNAQVLKEALERKRDPDDVLLELGFPTHLYTIFIYEEILMKGKDDVESVISALNVAKNSEILNSLGILAFAKKYGAHEFRLIISLAEKGIKYLDLFLTFHADEDQG